jgi:hypothetical protein
LIKVLIWQDTAGGVEASRGRNATIEVAYNKGELNTAKNNTTDIPWSGAAQ